MKIVEIGYHCCIRLVKEALALMPRHEVHCIGFKKPSCVDQFKTFALCHTKDQLREAVKIHSDADIFHVHNEPNWMVQVIAEVTDVPIVLDMHDSMAYREDKMEYINAPMEQVAMNIASGIVFVSVGCMQITLKNNPHLKDKPSIVLYPFVNSQFYTSNECSWSGGFVYEGLISHNKDRAVMQYGNYIEFAKKCRKEGIPFHIFSPKDNEIAYQEAYKDICFLEGSMQYDELIKYMTQFEWGLVGNIKSYREWEIAMPNKLFEYIASGLPVMAINAKESGDFLESSGFGIRVKSLKEAKERWSESLKCRTNIFKYRYLYTMEKNINKLEEMYARIKEG